MTKKPAHIDKTVDCFEVHPKEQQLKLQAFTAMLNREPDPGDIQPTPDNRARTLPISFVEMELDQMFYGQWQTRNYHTQTVGNEIVGMIELIVQHPVTGREIVRTGTAAIQIMVDKVPEGMTGADRNRWALSLDNKKPNALDMGAGRLKSECIKNAAASLGKRFGRDLNRKVADTYTPTLRPIPQAALTAAIHRIAAGEPGVFEMCNEAFLLTDEQIHALRTATAAPQLQEGGQR